MKYRMFFYSLFLALVFSNCSTANKTAALSNSDTTSVKNYTSLADYLRHNSNVQVTGVDPDIRLQIRGMGSLTSDTRPFIYVDKNPVGRNYTQANNTVDPNNIQKVQVIASLAELTRYGQEGHSGVIKIHTKSFSAN